MPTWPASLPQSPLAEGYQERARQMSIRFAPEAGPAIQRRRVTATVRPIDLRLVLTPAQVATLDGFWETDTAGGALPFDWVHPRTGVAATLRFIADSPPTYQAIDPTLYAISLTLEVLP